MKPMKKMSLNLKLLLSFGLLSLVILIVGLLGFQSIGNLSEEIETIGTNELPAVEHALDMEVRLALLSRQVQEYLNPNSTRADREAATVAIHANQDAYNHDREVYASLKMSDEDRRLFNLCEDQIEEWTAAINRPIEANSRLLDLDILNPTAMLRQLEGFKADHYAAIITATRQVEAGANYTGGTDHTACRYGQWLNRYEGRNPVIKRVINDSSSAHLAFHQSIARVQSLIDEGNQEKARNEIHANLIPRANEVIASFDSIIAEVNRSQAIFDEMARIDIEEVSPMEKKTFETLEEMVNLRVDESGKMVEASLQESATARMIALTLVVLAVVGSMIYGFVFGGKLSSRLNSISNLIGSSAEETKCAAEQVSEASSSLAEGASEQASSLEETSSAMEEMTSMVTRDAELASTTMEQAVEADNSVKSSVNSMSKLRNCVDAAGQSAKELSIAMDRIKNSSDSISKIIKTIDEIAFQTNILALNAAVEAARAGEAGAGFAVVADEVRSLAHRAAEAASETQGLIEESIECSDEGVRVNANVNERLGEVLDFAGVVDGELGGIVKVVASVDQSMKQLRASLDEQQSGIEQINSGVVQINDVTQSNAAGAEEAASASEQLTAQANTLVEVVDELTSLVNGHGGRVSSSSLKLAAPR